MIFLFAIVTCLSPAESAETPSVTEAKTLEQTAEDDNNRKKIHRDYRMDEITVTATKTQTPAELLPVTAHTVDAKDIEAQPNYYMSNFGELIRDIPGVHVSQCYPWGPPWVHLRGTGYFIGRTAFLVDGIPVTPFLSQTINNRDIDRVDVILGPSSAIYGANAAGGAVNVITKSGQESTGINIGTSYGSNNTWRPHTSVGDKTGDWRYYFSYNGDYSDGYNMKPVEGMIDLYRRGKTQYLWDASLEENSYDYSYLMGRLDWKNANGVGFSAAYNYENLYLYGGQPGLVLNDDGFQGIGSFKVYAPVGNVAKITATAGIQNFDRPGTNIKGLSLVKDQLVLNTTPTTRTEWTNDRIPLELQTDLFLIPNNTLTLGAFWSQEKDVRETYNIASGVRTDKTDTTTDQSAIYAQDQMLFMEDRLSLLAGLRWDFWKYHDVFDQASKPQTPDSIEKDHVTYRGGAKYRFNDVFALKSSAGTAFWPGTALWFFRNVQSGMTWREANPDLEPEKTWMVDLGGEFTVEKTGTFFTVTPYYGEIDDMVSYRYDVNPAVSGGTVIRTQNLGTAEIYGVELGLQQKITDTLGLFATLTLNHSRLKDSGANTDNQLRNAPDYWGSIGLRYLNPDLINAQATLRFSDDRFYDDENTDLPYFHMEAYQTVDAKIWRDWRLSNKWILTTGLSGTNLFDQEYTSEIVYVDPGFSVQLDINLNYLF
jgi:iron complex outermembrane receptor protein